jgi:2-dehydro-3-deoxyphosphogluconate aldolase / (4S)-4-hydroxy-2-oxoglutarate aldolase
LIEDLLRRGPVLPVVTLDDAADATDLARALARGGIHTVELTLRTAAGLEAIAAIAREVPEVSVGAGTVRSVADLGRAAAAGAAFAVSPGSTAELLEAGRSASIPFLPGVATASELLLAASYGYQCFKFFPAATSGGPDAIRGLTAPFPEARFCPTGGITLESAPSYLQLPAVLCVGGSWLAPAEALHARDFGRIEALAREAVQKLRRA